MKTKKCFKCNIEQPIENFYAHRMMSDGRLNKCKACTKADTKHRYNLLRKDDDWVNKERERGREKYKRLNYKELQYKLNANRPWRHNSSFKNFRKKILDQIILVLNCKMIFVNIDY